LRAPFARTSALAVALAFALAGATCAAAPEPTAADRLFDAARDARSRASYPRYAVYATVVRFRRGEQTGTSTWDTIEDLRRRIVHAHELRREEAANPHVPHGINFGINGGPSGPIMGIPPKGVVVTHEAPDDPIGQLTFAVDQDFGLAVDAASITASRDMNDVASAAVTLPRIGRTGTIVRTYEISDLGDVTEEGVVLHHLGLRPLRDPKRYRLRELWTNAKSSLPVRAVVAGVGNRDPLDGIDWRVEFAQIGGGTYVARESALAPLDTGGGRLDDVTIAFEAPRLTNQLQPYELLGLTAEVGTTDP
jgi:hypothetical protein